MCSTRCRCATPGTLAFAPIVDGDVVPDYPVEVARAGRTHPVPLIIGTNKHEAALFRFMKSPLMPITPEAIKAMFAEIAAEQPGLQLPSEAQLGATYRGRGKTPGMGVARDLGFRMPSIWFAEGHGAVAPVYLYRFDWATPMLRLLRLGGCARHRTALRVGQSGCRPEGSDVQAGWAEGRCRGLRANANAVAELRGAYCRPGTSTRERRRGTFGTPSAARLATVRTPAAKA